MKALDRDYAKKLLDTADVLGSLSDYNRLVILGKLAGGGPMKYTDLGNQTGFRMKGVVKADKESGKFAYHMRKLKENDLVYFDDGQKEYSITVRGRVFFYSVMSAMDMSPEGPMSNLLTRAVQDGYVIGMVERELGKVKEKISSVQGEMVELDKMLSEIKLGNIGKVDETVVRMKESEAAAKAPKNVKDENKRLKATQTLAEKYDLSDEELVVYRYMAGVDGKVFDYREATKATGIAESDLKSTISSLIDKDVLNLSRAYDGGKRGDDRFQNIYRLSSDAAKMTKI